MLSAVTLYEELESVLQALDQAGVDHALVGGLAVAVWGAPRATKDVDLLVRPEDVERALAALRPRGFSLPALPFEFNDGITLQRVSKVDETGNLMTVDFMLVNRNLEPIWASRTRLPFANREISVISRDALIAMKALAARPQDLADIQRLKEGDR